MGENTEPLACGNLVIIWHNPHEAAAENILGAVRAYRPGEGLGGCDMVDVTYESPVTGKRRHLPFGRRNVQRATRETVLELARNMERAAQGYRAVAVNL